MTILGKDPQGQNVWIYPQKRIEGMYVLGKTGSGKTTMLKTMAKQDMERGNGLCVIEPAGDLTNELCAMVPTNRLKDTIFLNPLDEYSFGCNIYECPDITDPAMVAYTLNHVMDIFEKLFDMSRSTPRMAQMMRHLALVLIYNPGMTILEIPLILADKSFREGLLHTIPPHLQHFWKRYDLLRPAEQLEQTESTVNKIDEFVTDPIGRTIYGQAKTSINFRHIIDSKKILLVFLPSDLPMVSSLLGSILISQLLMAALSRRDTPENKRENFYLYIDEFQNYATPSINKILTETRKFHIASSIFHQTRSQLPESIQATTLNTGSLCCFRLISEDAEELSSEFLLTPKDAVKPTQTVPRNVLDYIDRHPNEKVKEFAAKYIYPLQHAMGKKEKRESAPDIGSYEQNPWHDFGEGMVSFTPDEPKEAFYRIQTLFYECMRQGGVPRKEFMAVFWKMDRLLRYDHTGKTGHEKYDAEELPRRIRFGDAIGEVCDILINEPILATSTEHVETTSPQTFADKKNEIANQLVHLKRGHAMVKLPSGEYLMETIPDTSSHADSSKKQQIIDITRKTYCRNRHEVEEEIRKRQERDEPSSKRRGTV